MTSSGATTRSRSGHAAQRGERRRLDFGFCVADHEVSRLRHIGAHGRRRGLRNLAHRAAGRFLDALGEQTHCRGNVYRRLFQHPGQGDENHRRIIRR